MAAEARPDFFSSRHNLQDSIASLKSSTANQLGSIAELRLALERCLKTFRGMQHVIMPFAPVDATHHTPETADLHLPNSFTPPQLLPPSMVALPRLREVEAELRFAHAKEALDHLRRHLLVQVHYTKYAQSQVRGQSGSTRSQTLLQQTWRKIQTTAARYRHIRDAYQLLRGPGDWECELCILAPQDV